MIEHRAECASTGSVAAEVKRLSDLRYSRRTRPEPTIIVMPSGDLNSLSLLRDNGVVGVILQDGGLVDHFGVAMYSLGIQLAVSPQIGSQRLPRYGLIDGRREIVVFDNRPLSLQPDPGSFGFSRSSRFLNVRVDASSPEDISAGLRAGADGIGIVRTEWLKWSSRSIPTQDAYVDLYRGCVDAAQGRLVSFRLLDVGGDKIPRWLKSGSDVFSSPLGVRGIRARVDRRYEAALRNQLNAAVVVARTSEIGVIIPMVTDPEDLEWVRAQLLAVGGPQALRRIRVGIMVETPAAALSLRRFAEHISAVRVGPGDLTQFTTGKLRRLLGRGDYSGHALHPAVLNLVRSIAEVTVSEGVDVSICLDVDPRPGLIHQLIECGLDSICTSSHSVARVIHTLDSAGYRVESAQSTSP